MRNVIKTARWALLVMLIGSLQAAEGWTKYSSKPGSGSKVRIDGTSTIHDWEVEGLIIGGSIETGP